jgi:hypothetical protein
MKLVKCAADNNVELVRADKSLIFAVLHRQLDLRVDYQNSVFRRVEDEVQKARFRNEAKSRHT